MNNDCDKKNNDCTKSVLAAMVAMGALDGTTIYGIDILDKMGEWCRVRTDKKLGVLKNISKDCKLFRIVRIDKIETVLEKSIYA